MIFMDKVSWYLGSIGGYVVQMLPCMLVGMAVFLCLGPMRRKRLNRLGLYSGPLREMGLALFIAFCAGLAALTLFPANFWSYMLEYALLPEVRARGFRAAEFYLSGEALALRMMGLADVLAPFQEIRRALRTGYPWLMFMLWGNIGMFLPIGFCTALLWRKHHWWKSVLVGFGSSVTIEFVQFFIGRSTDIDDVILNTAGALLGYGLFLALHAVLPGFFEQFRCQQRKEMLRNGLFDGDTDPTP